MGKQQRAICAEMLIKLCDVYKVNNILEEFKGAKINNENRLFVPTGNYCLNITS